MPARLSVQTVPDGPQKSILFASCLDERHFVIDTLFVVDNSLDQNSMNFKRALRGNVPSGYLEVTLAAW